jgi:hypothetical protein
LALQPGQQASAANLPPPGANWKALSRLERQRRIVPIAGIKVLRWRTLCAAGWSPCGSAAYFFLGLCPTGHNNGSREVL